MDSAQNLYSSGFGDVQVYPSTDTIKQEPHGKTSDDLDLERLAEIENYIYNCEAAELPQLSKNIQHILKNQSSDKDPKTGKMRPIVEKGVELRKEIQSRLDKLNEVMES
ncbi:hypothetical protein KC669_04445 [Candidatus Dojkabacteria bacterium]|uniref:Uncharacterized protein n=1 Tax=Candidatus Dojkabacteria bacterium TaxID=2099670 RepID=A0A955LBQ4_9BACT|nr:hypothetical protein [Candidatus Dojkabacteria bacterium]